MILLFSGNHDKARAGLDKVRGDMEYLKMLIKKYVAKRTKVFWFSKIAENSQQKRDKYWKNLRYDEKWKTNPYIERLNFELFDVLRTEYKETGGNILPFFDIYNMSLGVLDWAVDGMHRKPRWYDVVVSNWIQTFCET